MSELSATPFKSIDPRSDAGARHDKLGHVGKKRSEVKGERESVVATSAASMRRDRLYELPRKKRIERLPLMVMLRGCGEGAHALAAGTTMNRIAASRRFAVPCLTLPTRLFDRKMMALHVFESIQ